MMWNKTFWKAGVVVAASALLLTACASGDAGSTADPSAVAACPENTILTDAPSTGDMVPVTVDDDGTVAVDVGTGTPVTFEKDEPLRIANFDPGWKNGYMQSANAAIADATEFCNIEVDSFDGTGSPQVMRNQLETAISSDKYNLILFSAIDDSACQLLEKAATENILVATTGAAVCGRGLSEDAELTPPSILTFSGGIASKQGYGQFAQAVVDADPDAKAIVLTGPEQAPPGILFKEAFESAAEGTDFDIKAVGYTAYTKQDGLEQLQALLIANPDVDLVASITSDVTLGAIQALDQAGMSDVPVWDVGVTKAIVPLVEDGTAPGGMAQYPYSASYSSIVALVSAARGSQEVPKVILNEGQPLIEETGSNTIDIITKDNIGSYEAQQ
jgi:ribose transport system substrate-binding protein